MFKVPDWENDIPNTNNRFAKKTSIKKAPKSAIPPISTNNSKDTAARTKSKQNNIPKKSFGTITNGNRTKMSKKRKCNNDDDFPTNISDNNNMELDEFLVNAKKIKLNKFYQKEDCEDLLFSENISAKPETVIPKNVKIKVKNKEPNAKSTNNGKTIEVKKRKLEKNLNDKRKSDVLEPTKSKKTKFNSDVLERTKFNEEQIPEVSLRENYNKADKKKAVLKKQLEKHHRETINISNKSDRLRSRMLERLKAAQFRYLNEKLYTSSGNEAKEIFVSDPSAFVTYHQGYQQQVKKWPVNPLDMIVQKILKMPKTFTIADMGCGEAALAKRLPHTVKSFDLVATAPHVVPCDMAHTPLPAASVDVVVYCLALMGTGLTQYLLEANRVLKLGGQVLIAEVESRFDDVNAFTREVERLGFKLKTLDKQHTVFFFLHFVKTCHPPAKKAKLPALQLKPCLYKKR